MADFTIRPFMSLCNRGDVKRTQTAGMKPDRSGGSIELKESSISASPRLLHRERQLPPKIADQQDQDGYDQQGREVK